MTQSIGQRLKAEREEQRLTLEKVFESTRIRVQYLQALEADDLSVMPSPVQARGYLRNYAEFLGFDADRVLDELRTLSNGQLSEQVIGPADEAAFLPQPDSLTTPSLAQADAPAVVDEPSAPAEESGIVPPPAEEDVSSSMSVPTKPKPARLKKADSLPRPSEGSPDPAASAERVTRRRGRPKSEPEVAPPVVAQSAPAEAIVPPLEGPPQTEDIDQTPVGATMTAEPAALPPVGTQPEAPQTTDVSDTLWQSWLSRIGSALSARTRRRTLAVSEPPAETEPAVLAEPERSPEQEMQNASFENSDKIFKEIGRELRARRELLSLNFDEVERNTRVKAHYLDALERGALDELPSTVQTRGMLSNYATFLDLDMDALLLRFADALQARHRERNPQKPARKPGQPIVPNMPPVRTFLAGDMIFGVGMAILLVGFAIWGVSRVMAIQSQREVKPTAPSISDVLLASPDPSSFTATPTFLPVESFPGEPTVTVEIPTQNVNAEVQLNLVAVERTYMRVVVDGEVAFDGRVVPGNAYPFEAENQIEVLVGSGAAIRTVYNGRDLGLMGTFGQVVNNIYSGTEIITPTAAPSATPTITLTPTHTAVPTSTLRSTNTPVPSATAVP